MNDSDLAFELDMPISEELLLDLTQAVDGVDFYHMVLDGVTTLPETERTLTAYIERATKYLQYLKDLMEQDDTIRVMTPPLNEHSTRQRIARVLRSGITGAW